MVSWKCFFIHKWVYSNPRKFDKPEIGGLTIFTMPSGNQYTIDLKEICLQIHRKELVNSIDSQVIYSGKTILYYDKKTTNKKMTKIEPVIYDENSDREKAEKAVNDLMNYINKKKIKMTTHNKNDTTI